MEQEAEVIEQAPASDTPTNTQIDEASAASSGASPSETAPDPKDRHALIKDAVEKARTNAAGRKIGADGKFVPEKKEAKASTTAVQAPTGSVPAAQAPAHTGNVTGVINAPAGLTVAMKARWGALPPEVQAELARLDRTAAEAAGKAAQPYAEKAKQADELMGVISPYLPMIQAEGGTPAKAIASLLRTAATLRTGTQQQKASLFMQLASQYGVQLPQGQPQMDVQGQQAMPDITAHPYVQQLANTVSQLQGHFTQQQRAEQERVERSNAEAVQAFMGEVDAKGQPKFPMEASMEGDFAAQIRLTKESNPSWDARRVLEQAYENLSWIHPSLRELRLKKQEEERQAKAQQELAAKKAAAVSIKGSGPSSGTPSLDPKDRTAVIRAAMGSVRR